jgi:adenosylcobinamide kinase / adenosylcobinamide-phosphate guanylyltransferase
MKIFLVTGGARSGKSSFAQQLAAQYGENVAYVATCTPYGEEMLERVKLHRLSRPMEWQTIEEPLDLSAAINKVSTTTSCILVDCLTLFVSNHLCAGQNEDYISATAKNALESAKAHKAAVIFVTNEVGSGIVPENKLARDFRDIAGRVNQLFARCCDEAYALFCGIPIKIK